MVIFCYYAHVKIVGQRLYEARMLRSMTQHQLGADTGNTRELISMVEHGRTGLSVANLSAAATALGVSTDFLCGLSSDPTPADQLADLAASRDLDDQDARAGTADDGDYIGVSEFATAAGGGAVVDDERVTGRIKFRRTWLARHGLVAPQCRVIQVLGESMEPTLVDGCSILVNQVSRRRRVGRLFVVRTDDGLIVKRAGRDRSGAWQLVSDNPNKRTWPTRPWPAGAPVIGEVKWAARTFL